jgi:hypothetical protein
VVHPEEPGDLAHEGLGGREHVDVAPEAVDLALVARRDDLDTGLGQQQGEVLALVSQRVVSAVTTRVGGRVSSRFESSGARSGSVRSAVDRAYCRQYHSASWGPKPSAAVS